MKLPFWATVFTITGMIVLCSLGTWQLKRLVWKERVLKRVIKEFKKDSAIIEIDPSEDLSTALIRRGYLIGEFDHDKAIYIQARTYLGHLGYHLITPMKMRDFDGKVVFVNRGWVPHGVDKADDAIKKSEGTIKITGALRPPPEDNAFVPENTPDQDQWYRIKPDEIAKAKGIDRYYSNIFYKEIFKKKRRMEELPIEVGTKVNISNNHAGYALFWFLMAIILVVIYVLRFVSPQFRKQFK